MLSRAVDFPAPDGPLTRVMPFSKQIFFALIDLKFLMSTETFDNIILNQFILNLLNHFQYILSPLIFSQRPRVKSNDMKESGIVESRYDFMSDSTERRADTSRRLPLAL